VGSELANCGLALDGVDVKDIVLPRGMKVILAQVIEAGRADEPTQCVAAMRPQRRARRSMRSR